MDARTNFSQADLDTPELNALVDQITEESLNEALIDESHIPVYFSSVEELINYVNQMEYFDSELQAIPARINQISPENHNKGILRFNQELFVVNRLTTLQKWKSYSDTLTINWFRRKLTENFNPERDALPNEVKPLGMKMSPEDWNQYSKAFDELFDFSILSK
ncbi:hypothetical protein GCM10028806_34400 [Spirosoma terrae]|uniref:Uncharacterized protein n=1 Tax=Spirosoma terrae TaxID=1968276 RepID=A0A6L9L5J0_9BACT|nr:hypothetical protein [Spirosoma terrae]NDU95754.1 hypothetical protein [Spirosoma terrae]